MEWKETGGGDNGRVLPPQVQVVPINADLECHVKLLYILLVLVHCTMNY